MARVVVTGAASGIGAATAEAFVERGFDVIGMDLDWPSRTDTADGLTAHTIDVSDVAASTALLSQFGDIVHLVNAAGVRPQASLAMSDHAMALRCLEVNALGAMNVMRVVVNTESPLESVVNVASAAAWGKQNLAVYGASKAALLSLTRTAALELASRGVRVNAVLPGTTLTGMLPDGVQAEPAPRNFTGRVMEPKDVGAAIADVAMLRLTTGATIPIGLLPSSW